LRSYITGRVTTPVSQRTNLRDWAATLQRRCVPTLVLFDERGWEIVCVDSVQLYRCAPCWNT